MEKILVDAVYFERKKMDIGTGGTSKYQVDDLHYHVLEKDNGELDLEMLNQKGKRTGMVVDTIDKETFLKRFTSCFEHECTFFPKLSEEKGKEKSKEHAEKGDRLKEQNQMKQAEMEYGNAIKFDEKSARANYGLAKVYLETGNTEKGKNALKKLTTLETMFEKENKHLFNEIGIDLRKQGLFDEADDYFVKALSIDSDDEALYYNYARLQKEAKKYQDALKTITRALEISPGFEEGKALQTWLKAQK